MQPTKTALGSFSILFSHIVLVVVSGALPVVMARFWLLKAGVRDCISHKHKTVMGCLDLVVNIKQEFGIGLSLEDSTWYQGTVQDFQTYILHRLHDLCLKAHPDAILTILHEQLPDRSFSFQSPVEEVFPVTHRQIMIARIESRTPLKFPSFFWRRVQRWAETIFHHSGLNDQPQTAIYSEIKIIVHADFKSLHAVKTFEVCQSTSDLGLLYTIADLVHDIAKATYGEREKALRWHNEEEVKETLIEILAKVLYRNREQILPHSSLITDLNFDVST